MIDQYEGTVKFFDAAKGFGIIDREGDKQVFVHCSALPAGVRTLVAGQKVLMTLARGPKGLQAENLTLL